MKKKPTIFSIIVTVLLLPPLLLLLLGILSALLRVPVCKGQLFGFTRPFVVLFFPPSDLFEPILVDEIDLLALDKMQEFDFEAKYTGSYAVYIKFDKITSHSFYETIDKTKVQIILDFYDADNLLVLSRKSQRPSAKTGKPGLVRFSDFAVPDNICRGEIIRLKARIIQADESLKQYGGYHIVIRQLVTGLGTNAKI